MKVQEIENIMRKFLTRMREKRPDLFEKIKTSKTYDDFVSVALDFMEWEQNNGG